MSHDDRADRLERLIAAERSSLDRVGEASPSASAPGAGAESADGELRELAALAAMLAELGRDAAAVDTRAGWAQLKPLILSTPQRHRRMWSRRWPSLRWGLFDTPAAVLRVGATALVLCLVLVGSALLVLPQQSANAAFARDMQRLDQTTAVAAGRGGLSVDDRVTVERQALAVLSRATSDRLPGLRRDEAERILGQLNEIRTRLVLLLGDDTSTDADVLAALNAVSGLLQSTPGAPAADASNPTTAAPLPPPTVATSPVRPKQPVPSAVPETRRDESGRTVVPAPLPSFAAVLVTVQPACSRVLDSSSLATCAEAVAAASAWCGFLAGDSAQNCERAVRAPLNAAQQRVQRLSAGCQRLPTTRAQQACTEVTERGGGHGERGNGGGRAPGHDQSSPDRNGGN